MLSGINKPRIINKTLISSDGVRVSLRLYLRGFQSALVLAHGFFNNKETYTFRRMAEEFGKYLDVVAFDFRGHGRSSGLFTWTAKEGSDLEAVLNYIRPRYRFLSLLGFSFGAATAIISASRRDDLSSIIAVSPPYDVARLDFHFWKKGMLVDAIGNLGIRGKGKGVRPGSLFMRKEKLIDRVRYVAPTPILFIHGSEDWLINVKHSRLLYQEARQPKRLEIVKGGYHAEKLFEYDSHGFITKCMDWISRWGDKEG